LSPGGHHQAETAEAAAVEGQGSLPGAKKKKKKLMSDERWKKLQGKFKNMRLVKTAKKAVTAKAAAATTIRVDASPTPPRMVPPPRLRSPTPPVRRPSAVRLVTAPEVRQYRPETPAADVGARDRSGSPARDGGRQDSKGKSKTKSKGKKGKSKGKTKGKGKKGKGKKGDQAE
jgi:hypothetical protein